MGFMKICPVEADLFHAKDR